MSLADGEWRSARRGVTTDRVWTWELVGWPAVTGSLKVSQWAA